MAGPLQFLRERVWSALPEDISPRMRRTAGWAWPLFLVLLGSFVAWRRLRHDAPLGMTPVVLWALAPGVAAALLFSAPIGVRVYRGVMMFFMTIGFVVSHVFMVLAFYLIVTPMGLLLRLSGKDLIDARRGKRPSWTPHAGTPTRQRFYRLF
jgi:hypothetical protein